MHGIAKAFLFVCLPVKRVHCENKQKKPVPTFLYHYHMKESLSQFSDKEWLVGDDPLYLKFWAKLTLFEQKCRFSFNIHLSHNT